MVLKYEWMNGWISSKRTGTPVLVGKPCSTTDNAQALEPYRPKCHRVSASLSPRGLIQGLLYTLAVSLHELLLTMCLEEWRMAGTQCMVLSSWPAHSAQPQSQAWHTPVFNMILSIVSHVRRGSPRRNVFSENETWLGSIFSSPS